MTFAVEHRQFAPPVADKPALLQRASCRRDTHPAHVQHAFVAHHANSTNECVLPHIAPKPLR